MNTQCDILPSQIVKGNATSRKAKEIVIMIQFKNIAKTILTILAVVPFSLIGILVMATVSKPGLEKGQLGAEQPYDVHNPVPSSNMIIDGRTVIIRNSTMSRPSQPECVAIGNPCETLSGRWVGVWGETVFRRNPS
ncbi:MAG: hypothetical protein R3B95_04125 [Nitrospirales bacterium]|nr:hypothetical protein [Nitrospirales bacterium]